MASYFLRPAGKTYAPRSLITIADETEPVNESEGRYSIERGKRWAIVAVRRRRGRWGDDERVLLDSGDAVHDWIEAWANPRENTYVISERVGRTLALTDWFGRAERLGCRWSRTKPTSSEFYQRTGSLPATAIRTLCLRDTPDIVTYTVFDRSIRWLSGRQYFDASHDDLADAVGYEFPRTGRRSAESPKVMHDVGERAVLWSLVMRQLVDWWLSIDGGPWGATTGQLAWSFFRRHLKPRTVLVHDEEVPKRLELGAITAGRASVFYLGDVATEGSVGLTRPDRPLPSRYGTIPGPLTQVDCRSMYPWLLASQWYPVKPLRWGTHYRIADLIDLLQCRCVIARVRLLVRDGEYPVRAGGRVRYPRGRLTTTLAGPELRVALAAGEVEHVHEAAVYLPGQPFRDSMLRALELRKEAHNAEVPAWELFVKSLSTSLSGKLAQRRGSWQQRPGVSIPVRWGEHVSINAQTQQLTRYRATAGLVEQWVEEELKGRPLGSCYAYLTSYARCLMRRLRGSLPPRSVVSQDTDGVWVLPHAADQILATPGLLGADPGTFRIDDVSGCGRWHGPKHYWTDKGWVLSGYHEFRHFAAGTTFEDHYYQYPLVGAPECPPPIVTRINRVASLQTLPVDGTVTDDGWIEPAALSSGSWVPAGS